MILRFTPLALSLSLALPLCASAAPTAAPAVSHFFKDPDTGTGTLSPDGRYFATTARKNGTLQLAVVDLQTREAKVLAGYRDLDIVNVAWLANNERLVYNVIDRSSAANSSYGGLYAVARTGGPITALLPTPRDMNLRSWTEVENTPLHMIYAGMAHDGSNKVRTIGVYLDGEARPYLIDSSNGKRKEIDIRLEGKPVGYIFDTKDQVRVAVTHPTAEAKTMIIWYRDDAASPWRKLIEQDSMEPSFEPLAMDATSLYVTAKAGARAGVYRYDTVTNKLGELIASDALVDVQGGLLFNADHSKLLGVRIASDPPRTHWLDPELAKLQAALDKGSPHTVNMIEPGEPGKARLIFAYSGTEPGRFSLLAEGSKRLEPLVARMPWIEPAKMAEPVVFDYSARDSTPIQAYLTLPKGRTAKGLPLIVLPHGGPFMRDHWGFSPEVQFLASRGYAVLQPQFRGSTGFGYEHFKKGFRQWGLAMQDDISDGVQNLVKQGVVDGKRVCIMGASYGGYAAMMGLVRDPAQYRCGVNLLGVTDLALLTTTGRWYTNRAVMHASKLMIADKATMADQIKATSPVHQAAKIEAPVFMAYGEKDTRVPLEHGTAMRSALKSAGKKFEWMSFTDEEHGFAHEANRFKVYSGIEQFLRQHNPAE